MEQKILSFNLNEIAIDYDAVATSINQACRRNEKSFRVMGLCQTYDSVFIPLEPNLLDIQLRYVLAPFSGTSSGEVEADLFTRWSSGFSTKGLIRLSESFMGLFEVSEQG